ncbi:type VI secretion system ATPase TssH [Labrenzia polysiphoniae]|uniref:Type VI secretion system ATPase TssH n=1 Tax=Roseibium polysiphoniae TaxID=2571221 RepID=A0ABR9CAT5_9HYPH|nr:type VI secretion system ATPase TssH [Roseibium polysiphoniae]MBD8876718.1 type VI secretion system ATPase TssH [Roseibium polysiphoniae]
MVDLDLRRLISRLNTYSRRALESAAGLAVTRGHFEVTIEHLLYVFVEDSQHDVQTACRHFEVDPTNFKKSLHSTLEDMKRGNEGRPVFSRLLIEWISDAWLVSSVELNLDQVRSGSLFATVFAQPNRFGDDRWLSELQSVSYEQFKKDFGAAVEGSEETTTEQTSGTSNESKATPGASPDSALAKFCTNFTEQARQGKIDQVFCRDREIQQMIDVLGRRRKNNPICVGDPGVGKTAVVEGLARKISEGDVPDMLKNVELIGLDLGMLQAGAGVKGEFENRLKGIIEEVKSSPKPVILFIDEAHMLIGAGGSAGGADAANLLKPALARGELRTIAATTWSEYKKYIEKDPALERRFQLVKLDEPSPAQAITIMRGLRTAYEKNHGVYIRDNAVSAAAKLSARYISGRQLPDKAVDVLDTACARVKLSLSSKPFAIELREKNLGELRRELDSIRRDQQSDFGDEALQVSEIEEKISDLENEIAELTSKWQEELSLVDEILRMRLELGLTLDEDAAEPDSEANDGDTDSDTGGDEAPAAPDLDELRVKYREVAEQLTAIQAGDPLVSFEVTEESVGQVIADWTGVPLGRMVEDDAQSILSLSENLKARVVGQDHAIQAIDEALRTAKAGVQNPDAPMGVFLFVGPSGVGKTELATAIADQLFGGERFLISINMSEFQEKHTVSKLVGSPPGYVGYGEGGLLTEAVRQRPYSVVLLDEVEKADLEVMNLFYQVFDKGMLADGEGRQIDFKNTIIVLTSNLATDVLTEMGTLPTQPSSDELVAAIRPILSAHFKPALLARMQIVPFYPLVGAPLEKIVRLKLNKVGKRLLENQKMTLHYSDEVVAAISARCTEVETGARNIDHIVNRTILPELSTELLTQMGSGDAFSSVSIDVQGDGRFGYTLSV